jgi:hypothetical protein
MPRTERARTHYLVSGALLVAALVSPAAPAAETATTSDSGVRGRVSAEPSSPLGRATVFAYELARSTVTKATTGADGAFRFDQLPAGVYKLIAFKPGYEPAVVLLSRAATEALQFVELKLAAERRDASKGKDFWAVRDQIPPDVLRDVERIQLAELALPGATITPPSDLHGFHTALRAMTGVSDTGTGSASQLAGGGIDLKGQIGSLQLGVSGEFWRFASTDPTLGTAPQGRAAALAVHMQGSGEGQLDVTTVSHRLADDEAFADDAAFERYRVSWSQPLGDRSRSRFLAQYTSQSNFLRPANLDTLSSSQSRALNVEGSYQVELSDRTQLETGLRYRERDGGFRAVDRLAAQERALELFGKGGWRVQPSVVVEYGLYTQLRDGSMALAPQGGVVVQLGDRWQATATASQRLEQGQSLPLDTLTPVRFATVGQDAAGRGCQDLEQHCYRVLLARQSENDDTLFAVGALHRELAETLHLYFDDDFIDHLESLYLVQGDELPEVQVVVQRRVAPKVLARLESSYAQGGGGLLYAIDDKPYENRVSYLVTSLDTRFQRSSTGIFLAFHHLSQGLQPTHAAVPVGAPLPKVATSSAGGATASTMDLERLQLMLSQDLNVLMRLAADWAVHLNFEVSRGSLPFTLQSAADDEVRRRVTGGLSVRF